MKDFKFTQEARGAFDILRLEGSLDMYVYPKLETALSSLLGNHESPPGGDVGLEVFDRIEYH